MVFILSCRIAVLLTLDILKSSATYSAFHTGGSTLGGCGDINRNVMTPPAPLADPAYQYAFQTANMIADLFAPSSPAFAEVSVFNCTTCRQNVRILYFKHVGIARTSTLHVKLIFHLWRTALDGR
jgi:hypothetical protein